jgi:hypothetical protein
MLQRRMMWEVDADLDTGFFDRVWRLVGERVMAEDSREEGLYERVGSNTCMGSTAVLM